jgi:hypothetical protein
VSARPKHPRLRIWSYRARALCWALIGALSFPLGWSNSVALVWIASLYANIATDISGAASADDRAVLDAIDALRDDLQRHHCTCQHRDPPDSA